MQVPFISNIKERVLVTILDELKQVTNPFAGMRIYLKSRGESYIVDAIGEGGLVSDMHQIMEDNAEELMKSYFPLRVSYDFKVTHSASIKVDTAMVQLSNFVAETAETEARIKQVSVDGESISPVFFQKSVSCNSYIEIVTEAGGLVAYSNRLIPQRKAAVMFFSSENNPWDEENFIDNIPNLTQMDYLKFDYEVINNTGINPRYLWLISSWVPKYVFINEDVEFSVEGTVFRESNGMYFWRSYDKLNPGKWKFKVR